ncbi:hypothetical protein GGR50DRAFT_101220 [Xylaria sp. CBS 124048]|nr:hypothetical protein GGR50DRAFT_101220 [Xylaria sp. CBS 124048]
MAEELAVGEPAGRYEMPLAIRLKAVQSETPDTASAPNPQGMTDADPRGACAVEDAANSGDQAPKSKSEAHGSALEDLPATEATVESTKNASTDEIVAATADIQSNAKKTKKRSKRVGKSRKNVTGFEEFFADPPTTPAEALEGKKIYSPSRPFPDRIEECIQRYRARRRLDNLRANMFEKYLFLGGIDSSQRQFTGMTHDKDAIAEADTEHIRAMTAVDFVGCSGGRFYNPGESQNWEVDFEAIVKGYLSRTIPDWFMYDAPAIQMAADLVKNFLNFVLMHDVCPEYANQIVAARHICDIAPIELRYVHELSLELPGTFNSAARALFCDGGVKDLQQDENCEALVQFRLTALVWPLSEKAKRAKQEILKAEDPTTIQVVSTTEETYQIIEIERPRKKQKKVVEEQLKAMNADQKLKPAGFFRAKPTIIAHGWGNIPRPEEVDFSNAECEEFVLEDEFLAKCEVGMKVQMTVCKLNVGIRFIKEIHDLRVSFDTFLPQYLMTRWKTPAINDRPPPSVHSLHAEEADMNAEAQVDD